MKDTRIKAALILTVAIFFIGLVPLDSYSEDAFQIAIVRADGIIIPIGIYTVGKWTNPWPEFGKDQELNLKNLSDIPTSWVGGADLSESWMYWGFKGKHQTMKLLGPSKDNQCDYLWGITSNFKEDMEICSNCCPFPKVGVASNAYAEFKHVQDNTAPSYLTDFINKNFEHIEASEIPSLSNSKHEYFQKLAEKLKGPPDRIKHEIVSVDDGSGHKYYHFKSERFYPKKPTENDAVCFDLTLLQGWLVEDAPASLRMIDNKFSVTDCDYQRIEEETPVTAFILDGKLFVVSQVSGYESEEYAINELNPNSVKRLLSTLLHAL